MQKNLKTYELMVIIKPQLPDNVRFGVESKIIESLELNGGKLLSSTVFGRKKFAYKIKHLSTKYSEGLYLLYLFENYPDNLVEIKKTLNSNENIIRFLLLRKEK